MKKYLPEEIEKKWQNKWDETGLYKTDLNNDKDNYYVLVELTYPSGDLHIGHWFTFGFGDILARFKKMQGYNTFFPNGFDAFGLPAENAAIQRGIHPRDWTLSNIDRMTSQFKLMGASFDWDSLTISCLPEYFKWNQWIFLKMFEKGLAYRGKVLSNWCPKDETVLANENVDAGRCWKCGTEVIQKEVEQWFFKITDYADRLIWDEEDPQVDWPKSLIDAQNKWIGKSQGTLIKFEEIEVFTTRPDTIFGVSFIVISPEHPLLTKFLNPNNKTQVEQYIFQAKKKTELERKENKDKSGVFTGTSVKNPLSGEAVPVWVADYVLPGYGTGAVMGVPAHDKRDLEFATKFNLEIRQVIKPESDQVESNLYDGEGELINSGEYTGLHSAEAREKITKYIEENQIGSAKIIYHLHDWSISRQRYWGTPIPIVHCPKCGLVPLAESDLPLELPYEVDYQPKGKSPLASNEEWINTKCPNCGGDAKRDADTMDTFVDSSWYFFRYLDPHNNNQIFDSEIINRWMPLKIYNGGSEHTLGHALYSRFMTKFFNDLGLINFDEYALKRVHHGLILGPDGRKMSKSWGNVINPDEEVKRYGADAIRTYLAFLGPYDIVAPWKPEGVNGVYHFLNRVWTLFDKVAEVKISSEDSLLMHKTIAKVTSDLEGFKYNTVVSALMEWLNHLSRRDKVSRQEYRTFLLLLAPFAPHFTEELWEIMGEEYSIHKQKWPKIDQSKISSAKVNLAVQINGKVREVLNISPEEASDQNQVEILSKQSPKIQKYLNENKINKIIFVPKKIINFLI